MNKDKIKNSSMTYSDIGAFEIQYIIDVIYAHARVETYYIKLPSKYWI